MCTAGTLLSLFSQKLSKTQHASLHSPGSRGHPTFSHSGSAALFFCGPILNFFLINYLFERVHPLRYLIRSYKSIKYPPSEGKININFWRKKKYSKGCFNSWPTFLSCVIFLSLHKCFHLVAQPETHTNPSFHQLGEPVTFRVTTHNTPWMAPYHILNW